MVLFLIPPAYYAAVAIAALLIGFGAAGVVDDHHSDDDRGMQEWLPGIFPDPHEGGHGEVSVEPDGSGNSTVTAPSYSYDCLTVTPILQPDDFDTEIPDTGVPPASSFDVYSYRDTVSWAETFAFFFTVVLVMVGGISILWNREAPCSGL